MTDTNTLEKIETLNAEIIFQINIRQLIRIPSEFSKPTPGKKNILTPENPLMEIPKKIKHNYGKIEY